MATAERKLAAFADANPYLVVPPAVRGGSRTMAVQRLSKHMRKRVREGGWTLVRSVKHIIFRRTFVFPDGHKLQQTATVASSPSCARDRKHNSAMFRRKDEAAAQVYLDHGGSPRAETIITGVISPPASECDSSDLEHRALAARLDADFYLTTTTTTTTTAAAATTTTTVPRLEEQREQPDRAAILAHRPCPAVLLPIPDLASIDDDDEDELSSLMSSSFARRRRVKHYPIINTHTVRATTLHSVPPALHCAKKINAPCLNGSGAGLAASCRERAARADPGCIQSLINSIKFNTDTWTSSLRGPGSSSRGRRSVREYRGLLVDLYQHTKHQLFTISTYKTGIRERSGCRGCSNLDHAERRSRCQC